MPRPAPQVRFFAVVGFVIGLAAWWVYGWPVTMLWIPVVLAVFAGWFSSVIE